MSISAVNAASTTTQATEDRGLSAFSSEDFFKLLITELQQQDPFEPAETADMISQVSQIRSIELSQNLTDALTQLTQQQTTAGVSELLGKFVAATVSDADGNESEISGIVTGVRFGSDGTAVLELDSGQTVCASDVTLITDLEMLDALSSGGDDEETEDEDASQAVSSEDSDESDKGEQTSKSLFPWLSLDRLFQQ